MRWTAQQLDRHLARRAAVAAAPASVPARRRKASAQRWAPLEQTTHEAIADALRTLAAAGVHWHHPATGELRDVGTARKLQRMGVRAGLPDFLLLIRGRLHGLELKRERTGRLSNAQIAMHAELREAGAIIATAHSLDEAISTLIEWGAFRPGCNIGRNAA